MSKIEGLHTTLANPQEEKTLLSSACSDISMRDRFPQEPPFSRAPSILDVIFAPIQFVVHTIQLKGAYTQKDRERQVDAIIRITQAPFAFITGCAGLIQILLNAGIMARANIGKANPSLAFSAAGIALCAIDLIHEGIGLKRQCHLLMRLNHKKRSEIRTILEMKDTQKKINAVERWKLSSAPQIEKSAILANGIMSTIKNESLKAEWSLSKSQAMSHIKTALEKLKEVEVALLIKDLSTIETRWMKLSNKNLNVIGKILKEEVSKKKTKKTVEERKIELENEHLKSKKTNLAKRISPWLVGELEKTIAPTIDKLNSKNSREREEGVKKARALLDNVHFQARKKILVHLIGVIAVTLTIAGLAIMLTSVAPMIPLILANAGFAFGIARYILGEGFFNSEGWNFKASNCVPECIKSIAQKVRRCTGTAGQKVRPL